jgi:hypothetical protein
MINRNLLAFGERVDVAFATWVDGFMAGGTRGAVYRRPEFFLDQPACFLVTVNPCPEDGRPRTMEEQKRFFCHHPTRVCARLRRQCCSFPLLVAESLVSAGEFDLHFDPAAFVLVAGLLDALLFFFLLPLVATFQVGLAAVLLFQFPA